MIQADEEYQKLATKMATIESQINNVNNKKEENDLSHDLIEGLEKELEETKKALEDRYNELANDPSIINDTMIQADEEYQKLATKMATIESQINNVNNKKEENDLSHDLIEGLEKELEETKKALEDRYNELANDPSIINDTMIQADEEYQKLATKMATIESHILKSKSTTDKKTTNELKKLKEIAKAYEAIFKDIVDILQKTPNFGELDENDQRLFVDKLVDEDLRLDNLKKYEKSDKLVSELKSEIFKKVKKEKKIVETSEPKPQPITKIKKDNKMLFQKSLAGVGGFVTGLGLSCVPGVGTIRMGISTAKLVSTGAKVWSKKYPEGKIAKVSGKVSESYAKFKKTHPKFSDGISNIEKVLNDPRTQWFINGMAAGYITGNMIEMITGKSLIENLKSEKPAQPVINDTETITPASNNTNVESITNEPPVESNFVTDVPVDPVVSNIEFEPGQTYDISALSEGLISSDSNEYLNLISDIGKDAVFDKSVILPDGTEMMHFKQPNGLGYAWFKADDVRAILENRISR